MNPESIIAEKKIEKTIKNIPKRTFTVPDFIETLKSFPPPKIGMPSEKIWTFGDRGKYTVSTYLSNRLDVYSHKPPSILVPFTRCSEGRFTDYRKTTDEERKTFEPP